MESTKKDVADDLKTFHLSKKEKEHLDKLGNNQNFFKKEFLNTLYFGQKHDNYLLRDSKFYNSIIEHLPQTGNFSDLRLCSDLYLFNSNPLGELQQYTVNQNKLNLGEDKFICDESLKQFFKKPLRLFSLQLTTELLSIFNNKNEEKLVDEIVKSINVVDVLLIGFVDFKTKKKTKTKYIVVQYLTKEDNTIELNTEKPMIIVEIEELYHLRLFFKNNLSVPVKYENFVDLLFDDIYNSNFVLKCVDFIDEDEEDEKNKRKQKVLFCRNEGTFYFEYLHLIDPIPKKFEIFSDTKMVKKSAISKMKEITNNKLVVQTSFNYKNELDKIYDGDKYLDLETNLPRAYLVEDDTNDFIPLSPGDLSLDEYWLKIINSCKLPYNEKDQQKFLVLAREIKKTHEKYNIFKKNYNSFSALSDVEKSIDKLRKNLDNLSSHLQKYIFEADNENAKSLINIDEFTIFFRNMIKKRNDFIFQELPDLIKDVETNPHRSSTATNSRLVYGGVPVPKAIQKQTKKQLIKFNKMSRKFNYDNYYKIINGQKSDYLNKTLDLFNNLNPDAREKIQKIAENMLWRPSEYFKQEEERNYLGFYEHISFEGILQCLLTVLALQNSIENEPLYYDIESPEKQISTYFVAKNENIESIKENHKNVVNKEAMQNAIEFIDELYEENERDMLINMDNIIQFNFFDITQIKKLWELYKKFFANNKFEEKIHFSTVKFRKYLEDIKKNKSDINFDSEQNETSNDAPESKRNNDDDFEFTESYVKTFYNQNYRENEFDKAFIEGEGMNRLNVKNPSKNIQLLNSNYEPEEIPHIVVITKYFNDKNKTNDFYEQINKSLKTKCLEYFKNLQFYDLKYNSDTSNKIMGKIINYLKKEKSKKENSNLSLDDYERFYVIYNYKTIRDKLTEAINNMDFSDTKNSEESEDIDISYKDQPQPTKVIKEKTSEDEKENKWEYVLSDDSMDLSDSEHENSTWDIDAIKNYFFPERKKPKRKYILSSNSTETTKKRKTKGGKKQFNKPGKTKKYSVGNKTSQKKFEKREKK